MPKNYAETIQTIREWKYYLDSVDNMPMNPTHTYKDETNVYERLTMFVKDWVEGVFGHYTTEEGALLNIREDEESTECKDWLQSVGGKVTALPNNWYQLALKGVKEKGDNFLPRLNYAVTGDESATMLARDEVNNAVYSTFFPAYRALRDSYSNRSFWQWIFNHKQYTAERDALKVMTSLITSLTGYTKEQLDEKYYAYREEYKDVEIAKPVEVEYSNRELKMNEPIEEDLFKTDAIDTQFQLEDGKTLVTGIKDDPFADVERNDDFFYSEEDMKEIIENANKLPDEDEPIKDNVRAVNRLNDLEEKDAIDKLCLKFMSTLKTNEDNEEMAFRAIHIHTYKAMRNAAQLCCGLYDTISENNQGEALKTEFTKALPRVTKLLFEDAFKSLGAEDTREIVKEVRGKEVREKVGGSLFGITTLKDRIVAAQRIANMTLKYRTPLAFYSDLGGKEYIQSYHILENSDKIYDYIKQTCGNKYGESEIKAAIKAAKNVLAAKHRGEEISKTNVFEIGYRPDPANLKNEKELLGNAQKMVMYKVITDKAMIEVINENVNRWKYAKEHESSIIKKGVPQATQKKWIDADAKLKGLYENYAAEATGKKVDESLTYYEQNKDEIKKKYEQAKEEAKKKLKENAKKDSKKEDSKVKVENNDNKAVQNEVPSDKPEPVVVKIEEPKTDIVPPVELKPIEINAPKIEK